MPHAIGIDGWRVAGVPLMVETHDNRWMDGLGG